MSRDFQIQVCSTDGQLLAEYKLRRIRSGVTSIDAAEQHVRKRLRNQPGTSLIVIVSEGTNDEFRQTHSEISFDGLPH